MPELAEVETPKSAGFLNPNHTNRNRKRIEEQEKQLAELEAGQEEDKVEAEQIEPAKEPEKEELSGEERTYKKRYSDLRSHLNKQAEELKQLKAQLETAQKTGKVRAPTSDESIDAWAAK